MIPDRRLLNQWAESILQGSDQKGEMISVNRKMQAAGAAAVVMFIMAGCSLPFSEYSIPQTEIGTTGNIPERIEPVFKEQTDSQAAGSRLTTVQDVSEYVVPGEYTGLVLEEPQVDDMQVEEEIRKRLEKDSSNMRSDAQVQEGDTVLINYVGTVNHKAVDGGIANNYQLRIGSGEMIEGFEEALIGMKTGQTREFSVTCPEGSAWPELTGVTIDYRVTLQSFSRPAQLTEEWAQEQGAESVDALRESVRRELADTLSLTDEAVRAQAWQQLVSGTEILDYPPEDIEAAKEEYQVLVSRVAEEAGISLADYLTSQGMSGEEFEEQKSVYARQKVTQNLILQAVMDAEGMSLTDDASAQVLDRLVKAEGLKNGQELEEAYGSSFLNESIALERVLDYVTEHRSRSSEE